MGRNNTKAVKNITKMYEQLGLAQDDIFHKTKLLLSIYRDVVWATLSDCNCVNEEIYYYGDDLTDALVYGMTERYNIECCVPDFTEALFRECFPQRLVGKAFALLTPIQQSRVKQHIFGKKSFAKIAASEGKAKNTVQESYDAAIKKMKKFLKNTLPKGTPYSE